MNQELMDMATKVGIEFTNDPTENPMKTFVECWEEELEAFAALVAAAEREACAKVCDNQYQSIGALREELEAFATLVAAAEREVCVKVCDNQYQSIGALRCANRIRARGETK